MSALFLPHIISVLREVPRHQLVDLGLLVAVCDGRQSFVEIDASGKPTGESDRKIARFIGRYPGALGHSRTSPYRPEVWRLFRKAHHKDCLSGHWRHSEHTGHSGPGRPIDGSDRMTFQSCFGH